MAKSKTVSQIFEDLKSDGYAKNIEVLKPFQTEVIEKLSDTDKHVMCVVPTGMGKTLCMRKMSHYLC